MKVLSRKPANENENKALSINRENIDSQLIMNLAENIQ
jgi:hypothetical protein